MNWTMLESSPEVAPLLVRLYDSHKLYGLAQDDAPGARAELTDVVIDLLRTQLNETEKELITDVLMALMRQAEIDLRMAVSDRLAVLDNVPLRMVLHLANDEIKVADPILRLSPLLEDMDLIYIIKAKGADHWRAIARREKLGSSVVDHLAETKDLTTAVTLSENHTLHLSDKAMNILAGMASNSDALAQPLLMRSDVPAAVAAKLYAYVGEELKQYITDHYKGRHAAEACAAVDDVSIEFTNVAHLNFIPSEQMVAAANLLMGKGSLKVDTMLQALRRGQYAYFTALLAAYCNIPAATVAQITKQENGQGLAIACRATSISKADFMSIYLLTGRVRNGGVKIVNQAELSAALRYYDKVSTAQARRILSQSRNQF